MKYSNLEENFIFEVKELFDQITLSSIEEIDYKLNAASLEEMYGFFFTREGLMDSVIDQIIRNVQNHKIPLKYIEQLKKDFRSTFNLIIPLRNYKYKVRSRFNKLEHLRLFLPYDLNEQPYFKDDEWGVSGEREHYFKETAKGLLSIPDYENSHDLNNIISIFLKEYKKINIVDRNIEVFLQLAENIQDTIEEAEKEYSHKQAKIVEPTKENINNITKRTKLQWNASKSSLYHLFAQLSEQQTNKGIIPLDYTPEQLAAFLSESFTNLPEKKTIEREIQKYRANGGSAEKDPPKDTIDLEGIDFDS